MEPIATLTLATIGTLVLTKAIEKFGEKIGEGVAAKAGKLLQLLQHKAPQAAQAIEQAKATGEQAPLPPANFGQAVLEVEKASTDPEVKGALQELAQAVQADPQLAKAAQVVTREVQAQPSIVQNWGQLAEKIGNVYQAPVTIEKQELNF